MSFSLRAWRQFFAIFAVKSFSAGRFDLQAPHGFH
jgi:hypothetical protein